MPVTIVEPPVQELPQLPSQVAEVGGVLMGGYSQFIQSVKLFLGMEIHGNHLVTWGSTMLRRILKSQCLMVGPGPFSDMLVISGKPENPSL